MTNTSGYDEHLDNYGNPGIEPCDSDHPWFCDIHNEWFSCSEDCPKCTEANK